MSNQKRFLIVLVIAAIAGGGYYFYSKGLKAKTDAQLFEMVAGGGSTASMAEAEISLRARGSTGADIFRAHLKDESPASRKAAIGALAIKKDKGSADALIALLNNPKEDAEVKAAACTAFVDIRVKEAVPVLMQMLEVKSEAVRIAASSALRSITGQSYSNKETDKWKIWWQDNSKTFEVKG
ncbi:MAG: HEAT repeat domain-containing protein [Planctomycetota bacterium]